MKAILVVDIPDDYDEYGDGDWYIISNDYGDGLSIVYEEDGALMHYRDIDDMAQLKPMPQKVWSLDLIERYNIDESKYTQSELTQLAYGYNTCIDELLGEEE